jgi:hypothetical protein
MRMTIGSKLRVSACALVVGTAASARARVEPAPKALHRLFSVEMDPPPVPAPPPRDLTLREKIAARADGAKRLGPRVLAPSPGTT